MCQFVLRYDFTMRQKLQILFSCFNLVCQRRNSFTVISTKNIYRHVLAFSVLAFCISAKFPVFYLHFSYLHFPVLAFSALPCSQHAEYASFIRLKHDDRVAHT